MMLRSFWGSFGLFVSFCTCTAQAQSFRPLPAIQHVTTDQAAHIFSNPPPEYGPNIYFEPTGDMLSHVTEELDRLKALGFRAVTFQAGRSLPVSYLSQEYFALVRQLVDAAAARDLRVWIVDDAGYPSGFAGGLISKRTPSLGMQALVVANQIDITPNTKFEDVVSPSFVSAVAVNCDTGASVPLLAEDAHIRFRPISGRWRVTIVEHAFRTSLTRSVTNSTGAKDDSQSLENYLDPAATKQFLAFTHEQYKKAIGNHFGSTVLGFRGDEPDFSFAGLPYTPAIFESFREKKGYDIQPLIAVLLTSVQSQEQSRLLADYTDVWSQLFRDNFFRMQAEWCAENHLQYQVHLNHEDDLPRLAVTEGDFFRDMKVVQIPGVDAIWHQIWKDATPDFPRLAASAAHLAGHAQAFTESFAAYRPAPTLEDARFILNEQIVRGINLIEVMHYPTLPLSPILDARWPQMMESIRRTTSLLSLGQPGADVALYLPSASIWMEDAHANESLFKAELAFDQHQMQYDIVDDDSLAHTLTLEADTLRNASGNHYRAVVIPEHSVLTQEAIATLTAFAQAGGKVIALGGWPSQREGLSFRKQDQAVIPRATIVTSAALFQTPTKWLPTSPLTTATPHSALRVLHRQLTDGEVFFLFNEGKTPISDRFRIQSGATLQDWDARNGSAHALQGHADDWLGYS